MRDGSPDRSPLWSARTLARIAGVLYVLVIIGAVIGPFGIAPSGLTVGANTVPSLEAILDSKVRYALGGGILLAVYACDAAMALLFHRLLKPVGRFTSLLAAFFRLAFAAIASANVVLNHFAPLVLVSGWVDLSTLSGDQLKIIVHSFLLLRTIGFDFALVFFAIHLLLLGYLVFESRFLPSILGVGLMIGAVGYLANILVTVLPRDISVSLFPYVMLPAGVAEVAFALWLLTVGVNQQRWDDRTGISLA